jgi:poly(3-hydroxybutyrate) depolymerase
VPPPDAGASPYTVSVTIAGVARTYKVSVPAEYDANTPIPLTVVFHGANGTSDSAIGFGLNAAAAAAKTPALFAFPQGVSQGGTVGWDETCGGADMKFFDTIVSSLESQYCINKNRLFVGGFSWGQDMSDAVGCCRGSEVRALGNGSGGFDASNKCTTPAPAFRFTSDANGDSYYSLAVFTANVDHWVTAHHCSTTTMPVSPSPCVEYVGCDAPVIWCPYPNLGHSLPPSWGTDTWAFLSSFK